MSVIYVKIKDGNNQHKNTICSVCSYCGEPIENHNVKSNCYTFCSETCFESWNVEKEDTDRIGAVMLCEFCADQIGNEDYIIYKNKNFCSESCLDNWIESDYLSKCMKGEISF